MHESEIVPLRGEAVTLWRLARDREQLHCFLVEPPLGFWLGIERAGELVFSQTYSELETALLRAEGLKSPLLVAGWTEVADH